MKNTKLDKGQSFDWGKTSADYGKYRDIYPDKLYHTLLKLGIGNSGQKILDIGTGTGILPRAMYAHGGQFSGIDASKNQIETAKELAENEGKKIQFIHTDAESIEFPMDTFDVITAVQCWHYFNLGILIPKIKSILKPGGKLGIIYMHWLPEEDDLVKASESLILTHNPSWSGGGNKRVPMKPAAFLGTDFKEETLLTFDEKIPFTREGWIGRIRASRGVGATLNKEEIKKFDQEHQAIIAKLRPPTFTVLHQLTVEIYSLL